MRVTAIGRTYLLRANRAKWRCLPETIDLSLITPPQVPHLLKTYPVEKASHWPHAVIPAWMSGRLSLFGFSPLGLVRAIRRFKPALIQVDEEPTSLALLEIMLLKRIFRYRVIFFTWENLITQYALPFKWIRWFNLKLADGAIAGNYGAAELLRNSGFQKPLLVLPQLGVDPESFSPQQNHQKLRDILGLNSFTVGYVGRLVPEKGLMLALQALAQLDNAWQWLIVGRGPMRGQLEQEAQKLGVSEHLCWVDTVQHEDVPRYLNVMDTLILPSQSTPRWVEQFGHVLIEAMACGVPVVGSDSGAIPEVIGDAGLVFPERRVDLLAQHLQQLQKNPDLHKSLAQQGRERVLKHYTHTCIAERTVNFWQEVCGCE